jgi:hypothetical protein
MAIIQMYRGHYVQLAVDRRSGLVSAIATKRHGQPIFFTTRVRDGSDLQGEEPQGSPGTDDARVAVLEAIHSPQAQVIFEELQRVQERLASKTAQRYETRSNA